MDKQQIETIRETVEKEFDQNLIPSLMDFIRIPNLSRDYDKEWDSNGLLTKAGEHLAAWVDQQAIQNCKVELTKSEGYSPFLFIEIDGQIDGTTFFYGHMDKQPHMENWIEGTGPTSPKIIGDRLYGRGSSDDGYSLYTAILAVKVMQAMKIQHPRIVVIIEADEESGSKHIDHYLQLYKDRLNNIRMIICLDSGAYDYERLWVTTSLRGNLVAELKVQLLTQGIHSGMGSGLVPCSFRILRHLLSRVEDPLTGKVIDDFQVQIPQERIKELEFNSQLLGLSQFKFPYVKDNIKNVSDDCLECFINKTWRATLTVTGMDGIPSCKDAGNVLREYTKCKISLRLPPNFNPQQAGQRLKEILEKDPPYNAKVECNIIRAGSGFNAQNIGSIMNNINEASEHYYGKKASCAQEGGSIPLMKKLQDQYPESIMMILGVLGPESNAHGPNESLHIPFTKKLTMSVIHILASLNK